MFNIIVSGNGEAWEAPPLTMDRSRFGEYSDSEWSGISLKAPESLQQLVDVPTLLMYELGASGDNARLVRYGRLTKIETTGKYVHFEFEPDADRGYMTRATVQEFAAELGMERFEDHRTHWAIKDGDIPDDMVSRGSPEPPERDIKLVSDEFVEAIGANNKSRADALEGEIKAFPASLEKATEFVRREYLSLHVYEAMPHIGLSRQDGRTIVSSVLVPEVFDELKKNRPFSLVHLLETCGGPTEIQQLDDAVSSCEDLLRGILASPDTEDVAESDLLPLWNSVQSHTLTLRLRRVLNGLITKFARVQTSDGYWESAGQPNARITAIMAVILQRLGNDGHRSAIRNAVIWLCNNFAFDRLRVAGDVVSALFTCEAIRRSGMLKELTHITDAGDSAILGAQKQMGDWRGDGWEPLDVTVLALEYFSQANSMLEQVDGFLLMARDFFRKAEELAYEGGVNNRRLATISSVHAVEMFLYGLFERRDDLGISAFVDRGDQTLGLRESLAVLQRRMRDEGLLAANRTLSHRDQLSALVGHRDMVIHRASEISDEELARGMKAVERFICKYGDDLMQIDLLQ